MNEQISKLINYYSTLQELELVYRPNEKVNWGKNRFTISNGLYLNERFKIPDYNYNHRTILTWEVVFDFDSDVVQENIDNSYLVIEKLSEDNIAFSVYATGNKGVHIHTFWKDLDKFRDLTLIKKTIMKYYAYGMSIDYQLASKHLVRMEYGVNEKKRHSFKTPLQDEEEIVFNTVPEFIISKYQEELNAYLLRRIDAPINVDDSLIKDFLNGQYVVNDGREKFLFYLIHALKGRIQKEVRSDGRGQVWMP